VELRGLRRQEYERLVEAGVLEGERVELIGGEIVRMSPQSEPHSWAIMRLTAQLAPLMLQGYEVRVQLPLAVDDVSLPEPDIAVMPRRTSRTERPTTALAVVEVAESSQAMDLVHKPPRYAAAGVPLYIVLDVPAGHAVVHPAPTADGYRSVRTVPRTDGVDVLGVTLDLDDLLG
jgi:Uma2 family endonuclease